MATTKDNHTPPIDSQDVGLIFVREYYTFLNKKPHRLHAFYNKDSLFVRGDEGSVSTVHKGQEEIRKKIEECKFEDCKVLVTQVDSQVSANNGILIQVLGEMCNLNGPSQKFSQTFFLATQPNGYYVLNDIFRFLKDEVEIDYYTYEQPPVVEPVVQKPVVTQPVETVKIEPKKEEPVVVKKLEEPIKKEPLVKKAVVEEPSLSDKKPIESSEPPKVHEEKKKKAEVKQQQKSEQKHQKPTATSNPPKSSGPKTWANLTASVPNGNSVPPTTTPAPVVSTPPAPVEKVTTPIATPTIAPATITQEKPIHHVQQKIQNNNNNNNRKEPTQIFVKLVVESINEDQLVEAFSKIGPVKSCTISRGRSCAFVEFTTSEACQKALAQHKVVINTGQTVLAEERRFNSPQTNNTNRYNNNNNNNNNNQQQQRPYEQRRSNTNTNNNNRRQNNNNTRPTNNVGGKGRGVSSAPPK